MISSKTRLKLNSTVTLLEKPNFSATLKIFLHIKCFEHHFWIVKEEPIKVNKKKWLKKIFKVVLPLKLLKITTRFSRAFARLAIWVHTIVYKDDQV